MSTSLLDKVTGCVGSAIGYSVMVVVKTARAAYESINAKEHRMVASRIGCNYEIIVDRDDPIVCGELTAKRLILEAIDTPMPYEPTWAAVEKLANEAGAIEEISMDGDIICRMVLSY